jgi:hypothetical protein
MESKRYLTAQAVKTSRNQLIPIWDERIDFRKSSYGTDYYELRDTGEKFHYINECIYDVKKRQILEGIEINIYTKDIDFVEGQTVYYEKGHRELKESIIKEIVFEEYELEIKRGKKIESFEKKEIKIEIDPKSIYAIKRWKPYYIMEDGTKIEWEHQIYHKV